MKEWVSVIDGIQLSQVDPLRPELPEHTVVACMSQPHPTRVEVSSEALPPCRGRGKLLVFRLQELRLLCRQLEELAPQDS